MQILAKNLLTANPKGVGIRTTHSTFVAFLWKQDKYVESKVQTIAKPYKEQWLGSAGQMRYHRIRKY